MAWEVPRIPPQAPRGSVNKNRACAPGRGVAGSGLHSEYRAGCGVLLFPSLALAGRCWCSSFRLSLKQGLFSAGPVSSGLSRLCPELGPLFHLRCFGNTNAHQGSVWGCTQVQCSPFFKLLKVETRLELKGLPGPSSSSINHPTSPTSLFLFPFPHIHPLNQP